MKTLVLAGLVLWVALGARAGEVLDARTAAGKLGETVVVVDTVHDVVVKESGTVFLNFGAAFPKEFLAAVVMKETRPRFPDVENWKGKRVRFEGRIIEHEGHRKIILRERGQITLAE